MAEVGSLVTDVKIGDRVTVQLRTGHDSGADSIRNLGNHAWGGYAEYVRALADRTAAQFARMGEALNARAQQEPTNPEAHYTIATYYWEKAYRDLWAPDSTFVFTCAPNDTHDCLLRAQVKNGVVVRINPTYGYGNAQDLHGNTASHRWDPRACQKGLALVRKFYGDRRVKSPMIRKGFKEWADAGFPRDPATGVPKMDTTKRGEDGWLKLGWDEAFAIAAKVYQNVATTYSGS